MTELPEINVMMMMMTFVNILYVRTVRDSDCSESFWRQGAQRHRRQIKCTCLTFVQTRHTFSKGVCAFLQRLYIVE